MKKILLLIAMFFVVTGLQACSTEEPIVEEPIIEEPIIEEPIVEEPIDEEPIDEEPIIISPNIGEALALETGEEITLSAVVTAIYSHNTFFVSDKTGSIAVFSPDDTSTVAIGDLVSISAIRGEFNGLRQLTDVTLEVLEIGVDLPLQAVILADADFENLEALQGRNLLIEGFTISEIETDRFGNITFTLTFGENSIGFRYDSRVTGGEAFEEMMELIEDGDVVTITGAVLGWFRGAQVNFSPQIEITKE